MRLSRLVFQISNIRQLLCGIESDTLQVYPNLKESVHVFSSIYQASKEVRNFSKFPSPRENYLNCVFVNSCGLETLDV